MRSDFQLSELRGMFPTTGLFISRDWKTALIHMCVSPGTPRISEQMPAYKYLTKSFCCRRSPRFSADLQGFKNLEGLMSENL